MSCLLHAKRQTVVPIKVLMKEEIVFSSCECVLILQQGGVVHHLLVMFILGPHYSYCHYKSNLALPQGEPS